MDTLSICKAHSKQSDMRCRNFAVKGKPVCHIHGGLSTGAKTEEGRDRQRMASWKHGMRSKEAIIEQGEIREFIKTCGEFIG